MSDVSIYPRENVDADLAAIMNGGEHFLKRMQRFLEEKDKADAILQNAHDEADALHEAAIKDRADAIGVIDDARRNAAEIIEDARRQGQEILDKGQALIAEARAQADKIVSEAKDAAESLASEAKALMDESVRAQSAADQRNSDLDRREALIADKEAELDAALESANAIKTKYEGVIARITAAIASEQ